MFGDDGGVDITVSVNGPNIRVSDVVSGTMEDIPSTNVARIALVGGAFGDRLRIATGVLLDGNTISGGGGDDTIFSGGGSDLLLGGAGVDRVDYSARTLPLRLSMDAIANDGADGEGDGIAGDIETIIGGSGNDLISGDSSANLLQGSGGKDTLLGGGGADSLSGGNGNDRLDGGSGADTLVGGAGLLDAVDYSSRSQPISVSIDDTGNDGQQSEGDNIAATLEVFIGGSGNDLIIGSGKPNSISGGAGNDVLRGGSGNDTIVGGTGIDALFGEAGNDTLVSRDGLVDTASGGSGVDIADADDNDIRNTIP